MPELRKDYVTYTWVVFSAARAQRPGAFRGGKSTTDPDKCPFCYGHEHMTPPEVLAYRKDGVPNGPGWWIRCVPNKYPALQVEGEVHRRVSQLFHSVNGVGAHEIIVETPEHEHHLSMQSEFQVQEIITAYKQRYLDLIRDKRFKYILIFKNHGERAGAFLSHPHSQLIATPIVPRRIMEEVNSLHHLRVDGRIVSVLRDRRDGTGRDETNRNGERILRLPLPICGPVPIRDLDPPEGPRDGVRGYRG